MKTVVIWDECISEINYVVLEGDYRHLDRIYINDASADEEKKKEVELLIFDQLSHDFKNEHRKEFPIEEILSGVCEVIVCGILP